jgi:hypothetical protein
MGWGSYEQATLDLDVDGSLGAKRVQLRQARISEWDS